MKREITIWMLSGLNEIMYIEYLTQCLIHNNSSTNSLLLSLSSITNTPMYFSIVHGCIVQWSQMDFSSNHGLTSLLIPLWAV